MADKRHSESRSSSSRSGSSPARRSRSSEDFDPSFKAGVKKKKEGVALLDEGVQLLSRVPGAAGGSGHLGRAGRAAGARRGRQGRDDPPRDERRQSRRASRSTASRCPRPRSSTTTSCGATHGGCPARGEIGIFNRSHYEEVLVVRVHPENLDRQKLPPSARRAGRVGAPLPRDQRLGALPDRERVPDREAVPQPLQGGAADPVPATDRPARPQLEVLHRRRQRARALGRLPEGVLGDALAHEHRVGAVVRDPGRPEVVRADRRRGGARARADGDRSAVPDGHQDAARDAARGQARRSRPRRPRARRRTRSSTSSERGGGGERRPERARGRTRRSQRAARRDRRPSERGDRWPRQRDRDGPRRRRATAGTASPPARSRPARRRPGGRALRPAGGRAARAARSERAAGREVGAGLAAVPRAVPQLHADHPAGRGDRVAGDQGVEHRRPADR